MKSGAVDCVRKPFRQQDLLDRIHSALALEASGRASHEELSRGAERFSTLTPREREVFDRVAAGQANKVIAIELGISERTVEIHRSHVMSKMEARSLAELVRIQLRLAEAGRV